MKGSLARYTLLLALSATAAWAQDCVAARGLGHATTPPEVALHDNDVWGGTICLTLNGQEVLIGVWSGQDGVTVWHSPRESMGVGKGGSDTFAFNRQPDGTYRDTLTTFATNATFPAPPGQIGFGSYQASHKIVSGTGRFRNATGTLLCTGPYVWLPAAGGTTDVGYFNLEISGNICNVEPAP